MDWIHCNSCSRQPGDEKDRRFALTSCGHIYCDLCVTASTKEKCKVCGSSCNTVELTAKMQPDVQRFFDHPEDLLKKAVKIMEFQKGHRQRLATYRRSMIPREAAALDEIRKLRCRNGELERQVAELKAIVMHYERNSRPKSACTTPITAKSPVWSNSKSLPTTPLNCGLQSRSPMMISPVSHQFQAQQSQQEEHHQCQSALSQSSHHQQPSVQTQHMHSQAVTSSLSSQTLQQQQQQMSSRTLQQHRLPSQTLQQQQQQQMSSQTLQQQQQQMSSQTLQQQQLVQSQQQQQLSQQMSQNIQRKSTPSHQAGAHKILEAVSKLQQQQQQQSSPATSSGWVTPNRLTLRKSPSTSLTPTNHGQVTPTKAVDAWNSSPGVRTSSQLVNPSMLKRLPGKISPYRGLNHSPLSASQGIPTSKDRFTYMQASQPTKFLR